jgi:malate synthase
MPLPPPITELPSGEPLPRGVELRGELPTGASKVFTPQALSFVADLVRRFSPRREELLERRRSLARQWDEGHRPGFLAESKAIRSSEWTVFPVPAELADRRVEITGPVDRKMIINALNSGANVFMADFEDSNSPTRENVWQGQVNLYDAVRRTIDFAAPETGKTYRLNERVAVLFVRPRGWHLLEKHFWVDGRPAPASLVDFGLYFHANAKELLDRGSGPYFYLPKLESHLEARLWNEIFLRAQERLGIDRGSTKATVLLETLPAAFEMDEILWELREHSAGLNCGRWDYIFSFIKKHRRDEKAILPDRSQVTMDKGFLRSYVLLLIQTCHRRNAHAMGGMAAYIPVKEDPAANERALAQVRADKLREVREGHDGTWVAHPGLVSLAKAVFDEGMKTPNQIHVKREDVRIDERDLLAVPEGTRTEEGLRHNLRVGVQYLEAWLRGSGCVPLYNLMEDAATAEISRAQVWQWLHHGAVLADGRRVTPALFRRLMDEEMQRIWSEVGERRFQSGKFGPARELFESLSTDPEFEEFLTLRAYDQLVGDAGTAPAEALGEGEAEADQGPAPWHPDPARWEGIRRLYSKAEVERLRGSVQIEHTLAQIGARRLWALLKARPYVHTLGALTGSQAVQMMKAGLEAIYVSGWQVAADANLASQTYPDQSLYPADSVPSLVRRINRALQRADQIERSEGSAGKNWFAPIVADAEAGFGGMLNAFELMKAMIEAGAAAVHFEDQVASEKKCGHMGGKVLVPTSTFVRTLTAARLAADVMGVPTVLIARTDADGAKLMMSDVDPIDAPFVERSAGRTSEGFYRIRGGLDCAIARGIAYAPYADLVWCETSTPDLDEARRFAEGVREKFPGKMLAYNCSPSFNWKKNLDDAAIARFQRELGAMGYKLQFVTLAGFHAVSHGMFSLAKDYRDRGMAAYTELQQAEFAAEREGYTATRHQREVGAGYFDLVTETVSQGAASTMALAGSTEADQFQDKDRLAAAQASFEQEHAMVERLAGRLRGVRDGAALAGALDELLSLLVGHFEREESEQGLYGLVHRRAPRLREAFDGLMAEHGRILDRMRSLKSTVAEGRAQGGAAAEEAERLAALLREHEEKENEIAHSAVEQAETLH